MTRAEGGRYRCVEPAGRSEPWLELRTHGSLSRVTNSSPLLRLFVLGTLAFAIGCEAIASFDRDKLDPVTTPPIVIPPRDGGARPADAGLDASDASDADLDAEPAEAGDDAELSDANLPQDGALDAEPADAGPDTDASDADLDGADATDDAGDAAGDAL